MEKKRGRGRPRNAESPERREDVQNDEIIARCVHALIWFGFSQHGTNSVYAMVGRCAKDVLGRHNHREEPDGKPGPLSATQVRRIYEAWRDQGIGKPRRKNFAAHSLKDRRPYTSDGAAKRSLKDLAIEMLGNDGQIRKAELDDDLTYIDPWTGEEKVLVRYVEDMFGHGDAEMTVGARAKYLEALASGVLASLEEDEVHIIPIKPKRGN